MSKLGEWIEDVVGMILGAIVIVLLTVPMLVIVAISAAREHYDELRR